MYDSKFQLRLGGRFLHLPSRDAELHPSCKEEEEEVKYLSIFMVSPDLGRFVESAPQLAETAKIVALILSGIALGHIQYIPKYYQQFKGYRSRPQLRHVASTSDHLPEGAEIIKELRDDQLIDPRLARIEDHDWVALAHTDGPATAYSGGVPYKSVVIPDSAELSEDQAIRRGVALGLFTE